jgi:hypothetical protein
MIAICCALILLCNTLLLSIEVDLISNDARFPTGTCSTLRIATVDKTRAKYVYNLNFTIKWPSTLLKIELGFIRLHGHMLQFCYERTLDKTIPI